MIVFPLNPGTKIPAIAGWSQLTEPLDIPEGHNYGILCGPLSGIFVVDIDAYKGQSTDLPDWAPETYTVRTGRGGYHLYFKDPGIFIRNSVGKVKPYTDIRGTGGFVVGPGSVVDGNEYVVYKDTDIADAPAWLLAALNGTTDERKGVGVIPITEEHPDFNRRVELGRERCRTHEFRDDASNTWEVALYLARTLELPRETCIELLWNEYNPRREKPLSVKELLHKIDDAQSNKYVATLPGPPPADLFKVVRDVTGRKDRYVSGEMAPSATGTESIPFVQLIQHLNSHEDWIGCFRFNEVTQEVNAFDPPIRLDAETGGLTDTDVDRIIEVFSHQGASITQDQMNRAIAVVAKKNPYNPIKDYLESVATKPHEGAIKRLCSDVLGAPDSIIVVRKWLMSAVRRALHPGIKADAMLVLQGKQKAGKSIFGEILFGREYFSDQMPSDLANKEASFGLRGKWCIEFSELASLVSRQTSREIVRGFITRTEEYYRPPYGRNMVREKRRCVFIGTTNEDEFLDDPFGERRYLVVPVKPEMDLELLTRMRDEIWSEAYALAHTDEKHYLTSDEETKHNEVREIYSNHDPWLVYATDYIKGRSKAFTGEDFYRERIAKDSIEAVEKLDTKLRKRVNDLFRRLGCVCVYQVNGKRMRGWLAPEEYHNMKAVGRFHKPEVNAN